MKNKFATKFQAVADDLTNPKLVELQNRLDEIQRNGMTALTMRAVLFQKMLDAYQVPEDHFLRDSETPNRIDDPSIINRLEQLGFSKKQQHQIH
ncbi:MULTISPECIES: hypothetical protein [Pseudoalteromonas]|uniref:Uncharacterized protein n=1 Tax=Pseudoalteromonas haloplanktis TaxID=228 RepID=A0ABU1BHC6_PSEHA|nr:MULTISPECIES: hypothetical protein [Pseudoalteromonas]MCF6145411.1 hypothetical protein [Pseudoalteromonas mariniglutinosa NCIMB 1770]MDQ9092924.1 hypothetical protein [Pseudoalteromonas haloplanktis]TMN73631.1 hypothetical protein CWB85_02900 [Pseudoalteromonas sp. S1727]BDF94951.1 hypothetical protein KAN5_17890 [Pseudoalteromonas sp. KAN5]